MAGINTNTH
ncbi:hypothetical protein D030_2366A, partial [Vibrio parahaemolyticus AQ3810]